MATAMMLFLLKEAESRCLLQENKRIREGGCWLQRMGIRIQEKNLFPQQDCLGQERKVLFLWRGNLYNIH